MKYTLIFFLLLTYSCNTMLYKTYGIRNNKLLSKEDIILASEQLNIPVELVFFIDQSYTQAIKTEITNSVLLNSMQQPLQVSIYDNEGHLLFHMANCDASGFPNLKWNNLFDNMYNFEKNNKTYYKNININYFLDFVKKTNNTQKNILSECSEYKYLVIVSWSKFMGRQNSIFIKNIFEAKRTLGNSFCFVYINTDNSIY